VAADGQAGANHGHQSVAPTGRRLGQFPVDPVFALDADSLSNFRLFCSVL
jgi:hypothetical protein